jgi:mevalonate kinase
VACVLEAAPIRYVKGKPAEALALGWKPFLYLCDTGRRSSTKSCVEKVESAARPDLDQRMGEAVRQVGAALLAGSGGIMQLAEGMNLAASCFEEWGLGVDPGLVDKLRRAGALAVKPTGSGGGGFLLTLWTAPPPPELGLIPVLNESPVRASA